MPGECRQCRSPRRRSRCQTPSRPLFRRRLLVVLMSNVNPQDAWRRLSQQLQRASSGGGPRMPGKGFFTGTGLLLALVGGGVALNASLFNGTSRSYQHNALMTR